MFPTLVERLWLRDEMQAEVGLLSNVRVAMAGSPCDDDGLPRTTPYEGSRRSIPGFNRRVPEFGGSTEKGNAK